jgi:hypothetical protein
MKRLFNTLLFFVLLFLVSEISAQIITTEQKQRLIANLSNASIDSMDTGNFAWDAVRTINQYKIIEAIPSIIENIWKQEPPVQFEFLETLLVLGSDQTKAMTLAFIDSVDKFEKNNLINRDYQTCFYKANATGILFKLGDYSTRNYLYDFIQKFPESSELLAVNMLAIIIKNVHSDEQRAKSELIHLAKEAHDGYVRCSALLNLYSNYGSEVIPLVKERFAQENIPSTRISILTEILRDQKSIEINEYLFNQVKIDTSNYIKAMAMKVLLEKNNSPVTYNYISNNIALFLSGFWENYLKAYTKKIFLPKIEDKKETNKSLIDTLISFTNQSILLNWVGSTTFSEQIKQYLTDTKTKLAGGDSLGAAIKIKQYQSAIVQALQDPVTNTNQFVTTDGYKFLYYYPKYILERLPKLPTVRFTDSQGKLIETGSLKYYEGAWKDAVNNKDGTFTVPTTLKTVSLRMTYEHGTQTKSNVTVSTDTVLFQTALATIDVLDAQNQPVSGATVSYYSGAWRQIGTTVNGVITKELLPASLTFRGALGTKQVDKTQNISTNNNVEIKLP